MELQQHPDAPARCEQTSSSSERSSRHSSSSSDGASDAHYVALVANHGKCVVMQQHQDGSLHLPVITDKYLDVQRTYYLSSTREKFAISGSLHVVDDVDFELEDGFPPNTKSVVIIQVYDDNLQSPAPFQLSDWQLLLSNGQQLAADEHVARFVQTFLRHPDASSPERLRKHLPWFSLGFYHRIRPVIEQELLAAGYTSTANPQQFAFSCLSCIYRVPTTEADLYVKFVPEGNNEIAKTLALHRSFPQFTPKPVFVNHSLNAFATLDFGRTANRSFLAPLRKPLISVSEKKRVQASVDAAMEQLARVHHQSIALVPELMAGGVPLYDREWIRNAFKTVFTYMEQHATSFRVELEHLQECEPYLEQVFRAWEETPLPNTIVHGDLHSGNITQPGGDGSPFLFFDWECSFIGHPFLDINTCEQPHFIDLMKAYLRTWQNEALNMRDLKRVAQLTTPLKYLIMAAHDATKECLPDWFKKGFVRSHVRSFVKSVYRVQRQSDNI